METSKANDKMKSDQAKKKMSQVKWKPIIKEIAIISAKGFLAGFTYQFGLKMHERMFYTKIIAQDLKLIEGGKFTSKAI